MSIDFAAALRVLTEADVQFVIVGGAAATAHGSTQLTQDLDVVYARAAENVARLVGALSPYHPYLRGAPPGLPFRFDEATVFAGLNFTLTTDLGDIDVLGEIAGVGTFADLQKRSIELQLFGLSCRCIDLDTLIDAKRAAGRPKDLQTLAELEAIRDNLRSS